MQTRHTSRRATLAAALLSAFVLAQPAHAGLLGGGSLGGGLGGGLGGNFGPRSLDVAGSAAGQANHEIKAPRVDKKAGETAEATAEKAGDKRQATTDRAAVTGAAAANASHERAVGTRDHAGSLAGNANSQAAATGSVLRSRGEGAAAQAAGFDAGKSAATSAQPRSGQGSNADITKNAALSAQPRSAQTGSDGSAEASRGTRSVNGNAAADGSAQASRSDRSVNANASGSADASVQR